MSRISMTTSRWRKKETFAWHMSPVPSVVIIVIWENSIRSNAGRSEERKNSPAALTNAECGQSRRRCPSVRIADTIDHPSLPDCTWIQWHSIIYHRTAPASILFDIRHDVVAKILAWCGSNMDLFAFLRWIHIIMRRRPKYVCRLSSDNESWILRLW